jgi:hypothetical protein
MTFARYVFAIAGGLGLLILLPMYFLEGALALRFPPANNHPEHYYAFIGVAAAFQFVYLTIARDPVRFRPIMPWGAVGKLSFVVSSHVLWLEGRAGFTQAAATWLDAILAMLFLVAWWQLRSDRR